MTTQPLKISLPILYPPHYPSLNHLRDSAVIQFLVFNSTTS
jgi:hypothetical protein